MAEVEPQQVLRGHFGEVQSLSFLSELHLFSGDFNGEVRLWDLSSCRAEYTVRLHDTNAGVLHLACLPNHGALVRLEIRGILHLAGLVESVPGSLGGHCKAPGSRTGFTYWEEDLQVTCNNASGRMAHCSPISQGRDGCVKVWALDQTGVPDRPEPLHQAATGSFNFCRFAVWAPSSAPHQVVAEGIAAPAVRQDLRGVYLASAAHDPSEVAVWRPAEAANAVVHLRQNAAETKHGMCMSLAFLAPAGEAASASGSNISSIASSSLGGAPGSGEGAGGGPRYLVTGYEDGVAALWDLRSPSRPLGSARLHSEPVMCCDARPAASKGSKGDAAAPAEARATGLDAELPAAAALPAMSSTPASYDLITGSADDAVSCCNLRPAEAQPVRLAKQIKLREAGTADVRIRSDGKLFACGCWDGRARLYSLRKRGPLAVLKYHRSQVTAVAFSPVTRTLATASRDTTVALWSVYTTAAEAGRSSDA